jgi:DUF1009 family protein
MSRHEVSAGETKLSSGPRFGGRVGLLAGGGRFPVYFAQAARRRGIDVVCVAIRHHADDALRQWVDRFYCVGIARLGRMIRCFRREKIDWAVMAGKIHKQVMFASWRILRHLPDLRMIRAWLSSRRYDNRDDSILLQVVDEFRRSGITFASALEICPELLVEFGVLTRRSPTARERKDIAFGWRIAKGVGRLDIGQCVLVRESAVLAVEAIEGTDQAILRAGQFCPSGGFTLVKVAKPQQDMRFDVPTIGPQTIETLYRAGGKVVAVEAEKTILIDREQTIARADALGVSIVALTETDIVSGSCDAAKPPAQPAHNDADVR